MSYSNTVTLVPMEGGAWPPVTARLWMLWTVLGTGSGTGQLQSEQGTDSVSSANSFTFSFPLGPDFSNVSKGIGVSLQDTARVAGDTGWWFRSGRFEGPLPTGPIEIVLLSPIEITRADFTAALPALPIAMSGTRTITFLSVISGSTLVATAAGITTELGAPVRFTCRVNFELSPPSNIATPERELFVLGFAHSAMVTFSAAPSDTAGAIAAATLGALSPVHASFRDFVVQSILPGFISKLEARYTTLALASLSGLIAPGTTSMPAGIVISVRSIQVTSPGFIVRGALGAFDGVLSKFPAAPPVSTGRCFIAAAATSDSSPEAVTLRAFRDAHLIPNRTGARLIKLYETLSPALAEAIRRRPALRGAVRNLLVRPAAAVARLFMALT